MAETVKQRLTLFRELITCTHPLFTWTYDEHLSLLETNNPDPQMMELLFVSNNDALTRVAEENPGRPIVLSSPLGFTWIVDAERSEAGALLAFHVLGPAFISDVTLYTIETELSRKAGLSPELTKEVARTLGLIPIIPITRLYEYGLMLHYCITGEKRSASDFVYTENTGRPHTPDSPENVRQSYGTWAMEQKLLRLIEEGNLNYREEAGQLITSHIPGNLGSGDSLRHLKNLVLIFTGLCARAAIRGGVSPDICYALADRYIQGIENCHTMSEVVEINDAMQADFVGRVHRCNTGGLSPQIQKCKDYIQIHIEEKLSLTNICAEIGYSKSWLSRKFKRETGMTVSDYIAQQKVERAKELLVSGNRHVQEIVDLLGFQSHSYFSNLFKKHTGVSPGEYRVGKPSGQ